MKKFLFFLVLMFPQIIWSSDKLDALDGKSIICERIEKRDFPRTGIYGFRFVENRVSGDYFVIENDEFKIVTFNTNTINSITIDFITWWGSWKLNRETLILVYDNVFSQHQCKVASDIEAYNNEMERHRLEQTRKLKDKLKKNKI